MIDEQTIEEMFRRILREEIDRLVPRMRQPGPQLTIMECAKRYRRSYNFVRNLIDTGTLACIHRDKGRNGRPLYYIKLESAERHPQLGGMA